MNIRYILTCLLLLILHNTYTAGQVIGQSSDNLRENAWAVVNNYSAVFSQTDINNATFTVSKVITILNKQGEYYANFTTYGDKFRELKDFSGIIKNVSGTVVKKVGKKDLSISSLSEHQMDDGYSISYECKHPTFPYTVEYNYSMKFKNGIISYPSFVPAPGLMLSVEKANYRVEVPTNTTLRYNANFDCDIKEEGNAEKRTYSFSVSNMKALDREPLAPLEEILPRVLLSPSNFCYDSHCGNMSTWNDYGIWLNKLLKDRDTLPDDFVSRLQEITKNAESDRKKAEILYSYLQNNFRYVSIQLGIGGFQPIEASSVLKNKFGDCKGLSNMMRAMLKALGIPSNYCEIYSDKYKKSLMKDFASITQTNHAILLVPLKNDSIWLECTSSTIPFGYIHQRISGHDAVIFTDAGAEIRRLPSCSSHDNKTESNLEIHISEDGNVSGRMQFIEHLLQYGTNFSEIMSKNREKEMSYINEKVDMPKIKVLQIEVSENRSSSPSCTLSANFEANDFINKTGTRLFAPVCPLKKGNYNIFVAPNRKLDIVIDQGYSETDTITFIIPESYSVESLPKDISIKTPYGTFETICKVDGNMIIYTQDVDIFTGRYDNSHYKEIKSFFLEINSAIKRKLVLKKI